MKAEVIEIQVGGGPLASSLEEAIRMWKECPPERKKLAFTIVLPGSQFKHITIRDDGEETVAYGDFAGLPDSLDYAAHAVHGEDCDCETCQDIRSR